MSTNTVILVGRLVNDPELRYSAQGVPFSTVRLAVPRYGEITDFFTLVSFRAPAEFVKTYGAKGRRVAVTGSLQSRQYTVQNTDGSQSTRQVTEVVVDNYEFVEKSPEAQATQQATQQAAQTPQVTPVQAVAPVRTAPRRGFVPKGLDSEVNAAMGV